MTRRCAVEAQDIYTYKATWMKRSNNYVVQRIEGQSLLVPIGAKVREWNGIIVLNSTGRYLSELLVEDHSLDGLVAALGREFGIDLDRARNDIQAFVSEISKWDAIEI
jgi:hypothetical protein